MYAREYPKKHMCLRHFVVSSEKSGSFIRIISSLRRVVGQDEIVDVGDSIPDSFLAEHLPGNA